MSTYELFSTFIDRCRALKPNDQQLLRFIIKRYNDCPTDIRISSQMRDVLQRYLDRINTEPDNLYVHLKGFLNDLKAQQGQLGQQGHQGRPSQQGHQGHQGRPSQQGHQGQPSQQGQQGQPALQGQPAKPMSPLLHFLHGQKRTAEGKSDEDSDEVKKRRTETRPAPAELAAPPKQAEPADTVPGQAASATVPSKASATGGSGDAHDSEELIILSDSEEDVRVCNSGKKTVGEPHVPAPASQVTQGPVPRQLYRNQAAVLQEMQGRGAAGLVPGSLPRLRAAPISRWPPPQGPEWTGQFRWNNVAPVTANPLTRTVPFPPQQMPFSDYDRFMQSFPMSELGYPNACPPVAAGVPSGPQPLQPVSAQNGPDVTSKAPGKAQSSRKQDTSDIICIDSDSDQEDASSKRSLPNAPISSSTVPSGDFPQDKSVPSTQNKASPPAGGQPDDPHLEKLFQSSIREVQSLADSISPVVTGANPTEVKAEGRGGVGDGGSTGSPKQLGEDGKTRLGPSLVKEDKDSRGSPKLAQGASDFSKESSQHRELQINVARKSKESDKKQKLPEKPGDESSESSSNSPLPEETVREDQEASSNSKQPRRVKFHTREASASPKLEIDKAEKERESSHRPSSSKGSSVERNVMPQKSNPAHPSKASSSSASAKASHKTSKSSSPRREEEEPQPGPSHYAEGKQKEASERHIAKLETLLQDLREEIKDCERKELDFQDMQNGNSPYIYQDKLEKKFVKAWNKLCELKKRNVTTGRPTEKKYKCTVSRYDVINRKVERYINRKKEFPDYTDIRKLVNKISLREGLDLTAKKVKEMAQQIFLHIGETLQRRRKNELLCNLRYYMEEEEEQDPATKDAELKQQLDQSRAEGRAKMDAVYARFSQQQEESGAQPEEVGEDTNLSEAEEEASEEEEEEGLELEDLDKILHDDGSLPETKPPPSREPDKASRAVPKASEDDSSQEVKRVAEQVDPSTSAATSRKKSTSTPSPSVLSPVPTAMASPPREVSSPHTPRQSDPDQDIRVDKVGSSTDDSSRDDDCVQSPLSQNCEPVAEDDTEDIVIMTEDEEEEDFRNSPDVRNSPNMFFLGDDSEDVDDRGGDASQPEPEAPSVSSGSKHPEATASSPQGVAEGSSGKEDAAESSTLVLDKTEIGEKEEFSPLEVPERCEDSTLPNSPGRHLGGVEEDKEEEQERGRTNSDEVIKPPAMEVDLEPVPKPDVVGMLQTLGDKEALSVHETPPSFFELIRLERKYSEEAEIKAGSEDGLEGNADVSEDRDFAENNAENKAVSEAEEAMDTEVPCTEQEAEAEVTEELKSDTCQTWDEYAALESEAGCIEKHSGSVSGEEDVSTSHLTRRISGEAGAGEDRDDTVAAADRVPSPSENEEPVVEMDIDCDLETPPPTPRDDGRLSPTSGRLTFASDQVLATDHGIMDDHGSKNEQSQAAATSGEDSKKPSPGESTTQAASSAGEGPGPAAEQQSPKPGVSGEVDRIDLDRKDGDSDDVCVIEDEEEMPAATEEKEVESSRKPTCSLGKRKAFVEGKGSDWEAADTALAVEGSDAVQAEKEGAEKISGAEQPSSPKRRGVEDAIREANPFEKAGSGMELSSHIFIPRDKLKVTNGTKLLVRTLATKTAGAAAMESKGAGARGDNHLQNPAATSTTDAAGSVSSTPMSAAAALPSTSGASVDAGDKASRTSGPSSGTAVEAKTTKPASAATAPKAAGSDRGRKGGKEPSDKDLILIDSDSEPEEEEKKREEKKKEQEKEDSDDDVQFVKEAPAVLPKRMPPPQMTSTPKVPVRTAPHVARPSPYSRPPAPRSQGPVHPMNPPVRAPVASTAYLQRGPLPNVPPSTLPPTREWPPGWGLWQWVESLYPRGHTRGQ